KAGLALSFIGDPDKRDRECVEGVRRVARVTTSWCWYPARTDHLDIRIPQAAMSYAIGEDACDFAPFIRKLETQPMHATEEAVDVVGEAEERTAPDVGDVVGRVRAQEAPVQDWDTGTLDWDVLAVDERYAGQVENICPANQGYKTPFPTRCRTTRGRRQRFAGSMP